MNWFMNPPTFQLDPWVTKRACPLQNANVGASNIDKALRNINSLLDGNDREKLTLASPVQHAAMLSPQAFSTGTRIATGKY